MYYRLINNFCFKIFFNTTVHYWFSVTKLRTVIPGDSIGTNQDLENTLLTLNNLATIYADTSYQDDTPITFKRLEHIDYNYEIMIDNPRGTRKRVIVRLWLGLSSDVTDIR